MLTKDDLLAIGELLRLEREETRKMIRASEKNVKEYIKGYIAENNSVLLTLFRVELVETNKHIADLASVVKNVTVEVLEHRERIEFLEEKMGVKRERN